MQSGTSLRVILSCTRGEEPSPASTAQQRMLLSIATHAHASFDVTCCFACGAPPPSWMRHGVLPDGRQSAEPPHNTATIQLAAWFVVTDCVADLFDSGW